MIIPGREEEANIVLAPRFRFDVYSNLDEAHLLNEVLFVSSLPA